MDSTPPPVPSSDVPLPTPPPQPSLMLKAGVVLATLLNLILVITNGRLSYGVDNESRMIGYVIGGVIIWPGFIALLFSISRKHRSPRRTCRVWVVTTCLLAVVQLGGISTKITRRAEQTRDAALLEEVRSSTKDLQRQIYESDDPAAIADLQKQGITNLQDSVNRLAPSQREIAAAAMEAVRPMMEGSEAYTRAIGAFTQLLNQTIATAESPDAFAEASQSLDALITQHDALIVEIENLDTTASRILTATTLTPQQQQEALTGLKSSFAGRLPSILIVRRTEAAMLLQYRLWITLLQERWEEREQDEEGTFVWSSDEGLNQHNDIMNAIGRLTAEQQDAQQTLLEM